MTSSVLAPMARLSCRPAWPGLSAPGILEQENASHQLIGKAFSSFSVVILKLVLFCQR